MKPVKKIDKRFVAEEERLPTFVPSQAGNRTIMIPRERIIIKPNSQRLTDRTKEAPP